MLMSAKLESENSRARLTEEESVNIAGKSQLVQLYLSKSKFSFTLLSKDASKVSTNNFIIEKKYILSVATK